MMLRKIHINRVPVLLVVRPALSITCSVPYSLESASLGIAGGVEEDKLMVALRN